MDEEKTFVIFSLKRSDLVGMGISQVHVDTLSDDDIEAIVADVKEIYIKVGFMGTIEILTQMRLTFGGGKQ